MPLYKDEPGIAPPAPVKPEIHSPAYRSVEENLTYKDRSRIINYIRGYPEIVTYYASLLGKDDQTTGNSNSTHAVNQQFTKISNFEIKVNSPITAEQGDNMDWTVESTASIYPCWIPNAGDQFIASVGDGRFGIFQVTEKPRALSHLKNSVHEVTYKLLMYATEGTVQALEAKVVKRLFFRKEWMDYGQSPLIEEHDYSWARSFEEWHKKTLDQYFYEFSSDEAQSFIVPGQTQITYDPFITKIILGEFGSQYRREYQNVGRIHIQGDEYESTKNFWDLLLNYEPALIRRIWKQYGMRNRSDLKWTLFMQNARFGPLHYIVTPLDTVQSVNAGVFQTAKPPIPGGILPSTDALVAPAIDYNGLIPIQDQEGLQPPDGTDGPTDPEEPPVEPVEPPEPTPKRPLIHPVTIDNYYVLSKAFYDDTEGQSVLEVEAWRFIRRGGIDLPTLKLLVADYPNWGSVERFYYTPLLLILVNAAIRSL